MQKCVFLDIDGTFRDPIHGVPESAADAVKKARENGHLVIICTGRAMGLIPDDIDKSAFDGFIAGGGCHVEYRGDVLFDSKISPEKALAVCDKLKDLGISHRIETESDVFMTPDMSDELDYLGCTDDMNSELRQMIARRNKFDFKYTIDDYRKNPVPVTKICTLAAAERFVEIAEITGDRFHLINHESGDISNTEILQKDCDKGSGIRKLCQHLGVSEADTFAFGDSMNDIDMFDAVGTSVAMGNGAKALQERADIVCGNILEDGLLDGFIKAHLI